MSLTNALSFLCFKLWQCGSILTGTRHTHQVGVGGRVNLELEKMVIAVRGGSGGGGGGQEVPDEMLTTFKKDKNHHVVRTFETEDINPFWSNT